MVADRESPGLAATEYSIVPLRPVPVWPEVIESHGALEVADHGHEPPLVAIVKLPDPPDGWMTADDVEIPVTTHAAGSCVTVWTCPPTVIVALRAAAPAFGATEYAIVPPSPVPAPPETIVSHGELEDADHVHHDGPLIETVSDPDPPDAGSVAASGATEVTSQGSLPHAQLAMFLAAAPPAVVKSPPAKPTPSCTTSAATSRSTPLAAPPPMLDHR
jgi:hypothetical protein